MFLESSSWFHALPWALARVLYATVVAIFGERRVTSPIVAFIAAFIVDIVLMQFMGYFGLPELIGSFGGYHAYLFLIPVSGILATLIMLAFDPRASAASGTMIALMFVVVIGWPSYLHWENGTGIDNAKLFAKLPNVTIATDDTALPQTDPDHIIQVTQAQAAYLGSSTIGATKGNLGSIYQTNQADYTLQNVAGHLYWIAPLQYRNLSSQVGLWSDSFADSPGFTVVDAENPKAKPELRLKDPQGHDYHLRYLPDAYYAQNLARLLYQAGYKYGKLEDATLEVDDNWRPFYTITYLKPALGGIAGNKIDKILVVDAQTGAIQEYAPDMVPAWIDRVMSYSLVNQYANDWGLYQDARQSHYWAGAGQYQSKPVDTELHYLAVHQPVWVLPYTSTNNADASSTGVMVVDTHDNKWTFYPSLAGIPVGDPVKTAFNKQLVVTQQHARVGSIQLYAINGEPTWVAIYEQVQSIGASYAGIAFLDAKHVDAANVKFSLSKESALAAYRGFLAAPDEQGKISTTGNQSHEVTGTISHIGGSIVDGQWTVTFTIKEDAKHIFQLASDAKHPELPLVEKGNTVSFSFLDTTEQVVSVGEFKLVTDLH